MQIARLIALAASVALAGCETARSVTASPMALCDGPKAPWQQINVRPGDTLTERTASAIEANNLAREAVGCKYQPPQRAKGAAIS